MKKAAHRALEIDATTAEAYTALAMAASYYDYDWIRADEGFRRALELNPNSVVTHDSYGIAYLSPLGRHEEAIAHGKRAKELDPLTPGIRVSLGWSYDHARRWDEAIAECEQVLEIDSNFYFTYWCLGFAYVNKGMYEEAIANYQRGVELEPEDMGLKAHLGIAYRASGMEDRAQKILEEIEEKARHEYVERTEMALAYIAAGNWDEALTWLEKAYDEHSTWLIFMNEHASFDPLRGEPRFQQLLRKIGFKELKFIPAAASE